MSMISEQVKGLRKLGNQWKHNDVAGCNLIFDAADTIETLSAKLARHNLGYGEWIPVSERLPEDKTYVLTTIQVNGRQPHTRSGFYHGGFFHNDNGDTWEATDREVKAWMPLPEPWKDGEE